MRGRGDDDRRIRFGALRHMDGDGGVRIDDLARRQTHLGDGVERFAFGRRTRVEPVGECAFHPLREGEFPRLAELGHHRGRGAAVAASKFEHQAFEIRRDLNIHRRRDRGRDAFQRHRAGQDGARDDVVAVGRDDQAFDRQAHAARSVGRQHIAEIAGRHAERYGTIGRTQRQGGMDVIDDLARDARPVDRVDRRQMVAVAEFEIAEQRLHQILAIVEIALDRHVMDIRVQHRRHLAALHRRRAPVRVQHDDVDMLRARNRRDPGRARIARRRSDDGDAFAALGQHIVEQLADELERVILERERGAVEQLQRPQIGVELLQRRDGLMGEVRVGLARQPRQVGIGDRPADIRLQHREGGLVIALAAQGAPFGGRELRPSLGHVQTAVARQPCEQHVVEGESGRFAAGREITQSRNPPDLERSATLAPQTPARKEA